MHAQRANAIAHATTNDRYAPRVDGKMVPNYDDLAPKGSYINAADFDGVYELARYLIFLAKDPGQYMRCVRTRTVATHAA